MKTPTEGKGEQSVREQINQIKSMKFKSCITTVVSALVIMLIAAGCGRKEDRSGEAPKGGAPGQNLTKVRVRLTWLYQASYLPFIVAKEKGFYKSQGLDVEVLPSGPDLRPITPVIAGEDQFGVEGASAIIQAAANGVPIVVVGTYLQRSPEVTAQPERPFLVVSMPPHTLAALVITMHVDLLRKCEISVARLAEKLLHCTRRVQRHVL